MQDEDYEIDFFPEDYETLPKEEGCGCSSHCMNCLGMSWKDFL